MTKINRLIFCFLFLFIFFLNNHAESSQKFVVLTPPKCGTHLLVKALCGLLDKESVRWLGQLPKNAVKLTNEISEDGKFVVAHNWNYRSLKDLNKNGYKIIFILRDPRDHAVSVLHWSYCPNWGGPKHIQRIIDANDRLEELITGSRGWSCYEFINSRLHLLQLFNPSQYHIVYFENLIGPKGNGSKELQLQELLSLSDFLDEDIHIDKIESIANELWGNSPTFHIGKIGHWKNVMNPHHIELYKSKYQNELEYLGYEKDNNW